jgi:hypothetical protein
MMHVHDMLRCKHIKTLSTKSCPQLDWQMFRMFPSAVEDYMDLLFECTACDSVRLKHYHILFSKFGTVVAMQAECIHNILLNVGNTWVKSLSRWQY